MLIIQTIAEFTQAFRGVRDSMLLTACKYVAYDCHAPTMTTSTTSVYVVYVIYVPVIIAAL